MYMYPYMHVNTHVHTHTYSGVDDLLPILSYAIIRSGMPQLVSECAIMEEFIHEGYVAIVTWIPGGCVCINICMFVRSLVPRP